MFLFNFFETLMWASFFIVFLFYASYFILLSYFNRRSRSNNKMLRYIYPNISFIVPVYNEEKIIPRALIESIPSTRAHV